MENESAGRIEYIDILRAIGILFMIVGHLGIGGTKTDHIIHSFHMPLFFIISGYFYKTGEIKKQIAHKAKTILLPYCVFGLVHYALWLLLNHNKSDNYLRPLQCLLFDCTSLDMPIAGALWFLPCLFFTELMYILVGRVRKRTTRLFSIVAISLMGNLWTTVFHFRLPLALDTAFVGLGLFYVGFILRRVEFTKKLDNLSLPWVLLLSAIDLVMILINGYINMRTGTYGFIPLFWMNAVLSTMILWKIAKDIWAILNQRTYGKRVCRYFCNIGRNSIIYLSFNQLAIFISTCFVIILGLRDNVVFLEIEKYVLLFFTMAILYFVEFVITKTKLRKILGK